MGRSICTEAARTRLDRRPHRRHRVSLGEGHSERFADNAAEFVRHKVDVIVTYGRRSSGSKAATSVIPIVFAVAGDPVGTGLIASLARPGGNVTGLSLQQPDITGKRLEMLTRDCTRSPPLAILANGGNPAAVLELGEVQETARMFGFEVSDQKSVEPRISRLPSTRSGAARMRSTSVANRS